MPKDPNCSVPNDIKLKIRETHYTVRGAISAAYRTLAATYLIQQAANCQPPGSPARGPADKEHAQRPTPKTDKLEKDFPAHGFGHKKQPVFLLETLRSIERLGYFVDDYYVEDSPLPIV